MPSPLLFLIATALAGSPQDRVAECQAALDKQSPWVAEPCSCDPPVSSLAEALIEKCRLDLAAHGDDPTLIDSVTYLVLPSCPCSFGCCNYSPVLVSAGGVMQRPAPESAPPPSEPSLFLKNIRVVDARGDHGIHDVLVSGDRIVGLDIEALPTNAQVIDGTGMTVLPGLIDTHVHISMAPGAAFREESSEAQRKRRAHHLRSYLAWGVTTILDPAILPEEARAIRALAEEGPSPAVHFLGPTISPLNGYVANVIGGFPSVSTPAELGPLLDTFAGLDPVGVKIPMEDGFLRPIWPLHTAEMRDAIVAETERRGVPRYIHASDPKMTRLALTMDPHALVHAPQKGGRRLARHIADQGAFVAPTLSIIGAATVPADELETARDPAVHAAFQVAVLEIAAPGMPAGLGKLMTGAMAGEGPIERRLAKAIRTTSLLHEAGVPLVLGSDSGNWSIIPHMFHGPTSQLELALLRRAGLSPLEVIAAATHTPARMLGLEDEIGLVEAGMRADLLVVPGNPLKESKVLFHPAWIVRNGEARTPAGWMND
jgi:predicted amidohydrolase YtcJ